MLALVIYWQPDLMEKEQVIEQRKLGNERLFRTPGAEILSYFFNLPFGIMGL
jgi:hypothetical protein